MDKQKGFILLGILFMMVLMAVTAVALNRRAGLQVRMAANQARSVQISLGQLAAIEHAGWQLMQNPSWRTDPAGEDYFFSGVTYTRTVLDSSIAGYTDAVTITVTAPGGFRKASTSFRVNSSSQENFFFIADKMNSRVRKVDDSGTITTIAGTGTQGYSGDGGPATSANLGYPVGVRMDASGNIYIADNNDTIRKVDAATQEITTVAGTGTGGYSGDGGQATSAMLLDPFDVSVDSSGNIYIADKGNHRIRKVDTSGIITTVAGTGKSGGSGDGGLATAAKLDNPMGVLVDASGNIIFSDSSNAAVRMVTTSGIINTIAGTLGKAGYTGDDGPATSAKLYSPVHLHMDVSGNLFIVDNLNSVIRKVDTSGIITTIAGTPESYGYSGDDGPATSAMLYWPYGVGEDASGNILIGDTMNHVIRKVDTSGIITTVAGIGTQGESGDGGPATSAGLRLPHGIVGNAPPPQRKYYLIADIDNHVIRKVDGSGIITTVAGTPGSSGYSGDDGPATSAQLRWPETIFIDSSENIYIADTQNNCIRKVDGTTGIITTVAGDGTLGYSGDGGQATSAQLDLPYGLALDGSGNIFIADTWNHIIRKVDVATGIITTVAGTPDSPGYSGDGGQATSAQLKLPCGVSVDGSGNIFIADTNNSVIRKVDVATGIITTVAGIPETFGYSGDGGQATSAELNTPNVVQVDGSGNIYIADLYNYRIRKVDGAGIITTVAGTGISDYTGDGGQVTSADLKDPYAVHVDASGNIFITEYSDHAIRKVDTGGIITTVAGTQGSSGFSGDGGPATSATLNHPGSVYWFEEAPPPPPTSSSLEKVAEMYWRFD